MTINEVGKAITAASRLESSLYMLQVALKNNDRISQREREFQKAWDNLQSAVRPIFPVTLRTHS